jgi:hypothetical protein
VRADVFRGEPGEEVPEDNRLGEGFAGKDGSGERHSYPVKLPDFLPDRTHAVRPGEAILGSRL